MSKIDLLTQDFALPIFYVVIGVLVMFFPQMIAGWEFTTKYSKASKDLLRKSMGYGLMLLGTSQLIASFYFAQESENDMIDSVHLILMAGTLALIAFINRKLF